MCNLMLVQQVYEMLHTRHCFRFEIITMHIGFIGHERFTSTTGASYCVCHWKALINHCLLDACLSSINDVWLFHLSFHVNVAGGSLASTANFVFLCWSVANFNLFTVT